MQFTEAQMAEMKDRFDTLLRSTNRPGIENLLTWLSKYSDFYTAPASANYHGSFAGGLISHSLNVYDAALDIWEIMKRKAIPDKNIGTITMDSVIICTLMHDLCKANFYKSKEKWWKDDTREYSNQWRKYMSYEIVDQLPLGHGEKSVIILQNFIQLSGTEMCAIRWHMGLSDIGCFISPYCKQSIMDAINNIPLVELLILSDHFASFIMEKEINQKLENEIPV